MVYKVSYETREGYVLAKFEGQESYEDAFAFWSDLLKSEVFKDQSRFLVVAEPAKALSDREVQMLCHEIARMSKGKSIAYVDPNDTTFHQAASAETVVTNRGVNTRVFKSEQEALEWFGWGGPDKKRG